ncbi:uncharacterized protein LOC123565947 isoform X2 [Mercenaria mercenaria]|nr:uncharacterized protein LOC123565947 isoform X2 [Mercenaria mercenaria]
MVDGVYKVQWGRKDEVDTAVVIAAGSEKEMKAECKKLQREPVAHTATSVATSVATTKTKTPKPRQPASVIRVVSPPGFYPETTVTVSGGSITVSTSSPVSAATTGVQAVTTSAVTTAMSSSALTVVPAISSSVVSTEISTQAASPTSVEPAVDAVPSGDTPTTSRPGFISRTGRPTGFGPLQSNLLALEASVRSMAAEQINLRKLFEAERRERREMEGEVKVMRALLESIACKLEDMNINNNTVRPTSTDDQEVPAQHHIPIEDLRDLHKASSGPGNMAAHLVQRLYPELFGVTNLRYMYSWNGGGNLNKKELCEERKVVVQQYVCTFYPEVKDQRLWKDVVVPKVNELLRRVSRQERKQKKQSTTCNQEQSPALSMPDINFSYVSDDFVSYMNL